MEERSEEMLDMYKSLGISGDVFSFGEDVAKELAPRFAEIDRVAEFNQLKVIRGMQQNRVSEACLYPSTG